MVRITKKIDYAISGALGQDELGALLQAAAGSTYKATELEKVIAHSTAYVTARDGKRLVGGLLAKEHPDPRQRTFRAFFLP